MRNIRGLALGLVAALALGGSCLAQAVTPPQTQSPAGTNIPTPPVAVLGWDSSGQKKCFIGSSSTCTLPGLGDSTSTDPSPVTLPDSIPVTLPPLSALNATTVIDLEHFNAASFNISSFPASSVLTFGSSEDGLTNIVPVGIVPAGSPSGNGTLTQISTAGAWTVARRGRYLHVTMTTYGGSGSVVGQYTLTQMPPPATAIVAHGPVAHSSGNSGYPVKIGCVVSTVADTTLANSDISHAFCSTSGALIFKPYAVPDLDWTSGAAVAITNSTTPVQVTGAAGSGLRKYVTGCEVSTDTLGAANVLQLQDGSGGTVLASWRLQTTAMEVKPLPFATPYRTSANTALFVATTGATTGGVYVTCRGYIAP